jgi:hypothetical protein
MIRVANKNVKMIENFKLSRNGGLCVNKISMSNRTKYLESYHEWKLNYPTLELP